MSGLVPAEEEADLKPEFKAVLQSRAHPCQGIYALDGDKLTICWGEWSSDRGSSRPTEFTAGEGSNRMLLVLKRSNGR